MKIRTAILGYGRSGSTMHAGAIEKSPDFTLAAMCDIDSARRTQAAERFGCAVYEDYAEMLERERIDLVCIVTRSDQHCRMTCDCLAAGVNVLVTKPWSVNAAEGRLMVQAAESSGKLLLPWLPARWGSTFRRLGQLLAENAIGSVFMVRRTVSSFGTRCDWQTQRRYGGGYLLNWGPHIVDPALLLLGSPVASVYAYMKQVINPGDAEDVFLAVLTLETGAVVLAEYTLSTERMPDWFVQGDRGTIVVYGNDLKVCKHTPERPADPTAFNTMQSANEERIEEHVAGAECGDENEIYREAAQALRGERPFPVTPADALRLSEIFDAIRTASETGEVVRL